MIRSIEITNPDRLPVEYARDIFKKGDRYEFKPGVNIIVGENACGKSTLLKIAKAYMLCNESNQPCSSLLSGLFEWSNRKFNDGAEVKADYKLAPFSLRTITDMDENEKLGSFENFGLTYMSMNSSEGEKLLLSLQHLFKKMFADNKDNNFPIKEINDIKEHGNDTYREYAKQYLDYVEKNRIEDGLKEYTVFMDEPDKNLSIGNIEQIHNILSLHKERTQVVAVIHNPVLIYALSKNKDINFIEMSENYIDKVRKFVDKYTK